jgi:hypothetical protein
MSYRAIILTSFQRRPLWQCASVYFRNMTVGSPDAGIVQAAQVESADHHDKLFLATLAHARDGS